MTKNMKWNFKFVNISGNAYHAVTAKCFEEDYIINCAVAAQVAHAYYYCALTYSE